MKEILIEMANEYIGINKEELVTKLYNKIGLNHEVAILNDRYLIVDGVQYCFTKRNGLYTVKEF